jgi:hypothetical protein
MLDFLVKVIDENKSELLRFIMWIKVAYKQQKEKTENNWTRKANLYFGNILSNGRKVS